jgi:uncharacterized protein (DUF302 family)
MKTRIRAWVGLFGTLLLAQVTAAADDFVVILSKKASFDDVRENVVMAIENRGMKIDHEGFVADMLARTGPDIGRTRAVYLRGDQIQFCKADLSRTMMEADPRNIVFCPFIVSVYTTPDKPDVVPVAYRKPYAPGASRASKQASTDLEKMLAEIVRESLQ